MPYARRDTRNSVVDARRYRFAFSVAMALLDAGRANTGNHMKTPQPMKKMPTPR